jgi:hypothetical protein
VAQLIMTNLYLGLAEGAMESARRYLREDARPWFASGPEVKDAIDDPFVQHRFGQFRLLVRPAELLADHAARELDAAWGRGAELTAAGRGEVALAVAEAKVLAHRAAIEVGEPAVRADRRPFDRRPLRLRPLLAQRPRAHPARSGRLQAARPRPPCARRPLARTHALLVRGDRE